VDQRFQRAGARGAAAALGCAVAALTLGVASLVAASAPSVPSFNRGTVYAVGSDPQSVAIGDLNGDGKPDLVTANYGPEYGGEHVDSVSVLLKKGGGGFQAKRDYRTGINPYAVAIGDLNHDGSPDIATANPDSNTASVLLNDGNGSLQTHIEYRTGREPDDVAIADVNGDGSLDLVVANSSGNTVSLLLGRGDGTFEPRRNYPTARAPYALAVGDVNADRKSDIAVATWTDDFVSVLLNRGDGSFEPRVNYRVGGGPASIAIVDINGDGKPDLATANFSSNEVSSISVLLNVGDGAFRHTIDSYPRPADLYEFVSLAIGDFNGDARPDLAISEGHKHGDVTILLNGGSGRFRAAHDYRSGLQLNGDDALAIGDVNGDGRPDIVTVGSRGTLVTSPGGVSVLLRDSGRPCIVPELGYGKLTLAAAKHALRRVNCRVGKISWFPNAAVRKGNVLFSDPDPPTVLPGGGKVDLVASSGRKR
jgi:hypothetical protein